MSNRNELVRRLLSAITLSELQNLANVREEANRPIPTPRQNVHQLIQNDENNIIQPPPQFRDEPILPPPQFRENVPIPDPTTKKQQPIPAPRTKINQKQRALKGFMQSFEISLKSNRDALVQLQNIRLAISQLFGTLLQRTKGFKFVETLELTFTKRKDDKNIYKPAYFHSRAQIVINQNDFMSSLQLSQQKLLNGIAVWLSEGSGWVINSIDEHYINTVVYDPLRGSSYIPLPLGLKNSSRGLINIKNEGNECFRWCHIRYLNLQKKDTQRIKKSDKEILLQSDYEGIEFPVSVKDYSKLKFKNTININVFGYENKQFYPIYVSKECNEDVLNLLLVTKDDKKHLLIENFNSFMYNKTKHEH